MPKKFTQEEFLQKLSEKNIYYKNGDFKVTGIISNLLHKVEVETKYGLCLIEANSLLKGIKPSIHSAKDKNDYCIKMFRDFHGEKYEYPDLNYTTNKIKIKAVCKNHGEFYVIPKEHFKGSNCRKCSFQLSSFKLSDWKNMNPENNGVLYLIKCFNKDEEFLKIGITSKTIKERYKSPSKMPYDYEVLYNLNYPNRDIIWELEKEIKNKIPSYNPIIKFKGHLTECFNVKNQEEILKILKAQENYQIENWNNN